MADIRCSQCGKYMTQDNDPCDNCHNINREAELETRVKNEKLRTPAEYLDLLREEFDGGNGFIFRIYEERTRSYTVDEFLKLPAREGWLGVITVCRDGFGWGLAKHDNVFGFPCPWNVPGPGEHIPKTLQEEVKEILEDMQRGPESGGLSEKEAIKQILEILEP